MAGAYFTVADVQSEFRSITFSTTTTPTLATVTAFVAQACVEIETKVGMKYAVPVTAADAVTLLQQIGISLVAGRVKNILPVKTGSEEVNTGGRGRPGDAMIKWARDTLEQIRLGNLALQGATLAGSADGVVSGIGNAVTGDQDADTGEGSQQTAPYHIFRRDFDQW